MTDLYAGIGLRQPHYAELLQSPPPLAFVEVHAENFFGDGGAAQGVLQAARGHWPVSLHGVGLSLGAAAGLDAWHLDRLAALVQRVDPVRVSDHASFRAPRRHGEPVVHGSDLLPIAFTEAALAIMVANVQQVQDRLRRPILVENLSAYLHWADDRLPEPEFFNRLTRRSGCGLLLDVNNLVVNALNVMRDETAAVAAACAWVDAIDPASVGEIHLAGYNASGSLVIDDHGSRVHAPVWRVFEHTLRRLGPRPTLVEWDTDVPELAVLLAEAAAAEQRLQAGSGGLRFMSVGDREALRQQMLLRALWQDARPGVLAGWTRDGENFARGLQVYRANAGALAERALAAACPTLQQLLGEDSFAAMARAFWHRHAPLSGDIAQWGHELPAFIAAAEQLAAEPYLADVARLEWAVHRAQTAADAAGGVAGLDALAGTDAPRCVLQARPGTALLESPHPVVSIWQAHRATGPDRFDGVRQALADERAETALVWREGWVVRVAAVPAAERAFTRAVLQTQPLGAALEAAGADFDFAAWLVQALRRGWLAGVAGPGAV